LLDGRDAESYAEPRGRVKKTLDFLRSRGVLAECDAIADVGCGPGLFMQEFAKTAANVCGIDCSKRFLDYAKARTEYRNVSYLNQDFLKLDIMESGLACSFDLVFASMAPFISELGCLEKLMLMSRKWCLCAMVAQKADSLAEMVSREAFGEELKSQANGMGFYALFNLLWLEGYSPEVCYIDEDRIEPFEPNPETAIKLAFSCGKRDSESAKRAFEFIKGFGPDRRRRIKSRIGLVLWNVRSQERR
jgi:SAM-dependent methyltransferase